MAAAQAEAEAEVEEAKTSSAQARAEERELQACVVARKVHAMRDRALRVLRARVHMHVCGC